MGTEQLTLFFFFLTICINLFILLPVTNSLLDPGFPEVVHNLKCVFFPLSLATILHVHNSFSLFSYWQVCINIYVQINIILFLKYSAPFTPPFTPISLRKKMHLGQNKKYVCFLLHLKTSSPKGNDAHLRVIIQSEKKWKH